MTESIKFKIILPSKTIADIDSLLVTLPGTKGVFGVMRGHAKLTANIKEGVILVDSISGNKRFYVHGGVVQITGEELNVLTEFAEDLSLTRADIVKEKILDLGSALKQLEAGSVQAEITAAKLAKYESLIKNLG